MSKKEKLANQRNKASLNMHFKQCMDEGIDSWRRLRTGRMEIGWGSQTDSCEDINDPAFFVH